jgi:leucyl/phenylalanyl-tRNA--protein transferase
VEKADFDRMTLDAHPLSLSGTHEGVTERRAALFRETPAETVERWLLGAAWACKPGRMQGLPALARLWVTDLVSPVSGMPDPEKSLNAPRGLCGIAHDISPQTLVEAYRQGLFTFAHFGPLKWFSLPERCVLFLEEMHVSKKIKRLLRQGRYRVTFDRDFERVISACAGRRDGKWHVTWITPRIMRAYADLYDAGYVHSFEVWNAEGALVGGGYGVALGRVFFTESQFSLESDTSKLGFTVLNQHLADWGFVLNDGKWQTPTIQAMGFRDIPRAAFRARLDLDRDMTAPLKSGRWQVEANLSPVASACPATSRDLVKSEPHGPREPNGALA